MFLLLGCCFAPKPCRVIPEWGTLVRPDPHVRIPMGRVAAPDQKHEAQTVFPEVRETEKFEVHSSCRLCNCLREHKEDMLVGNPDREKRVKSKTANRAPECNNYGASTY